MKSGFLRFIYMQRVFSFITFISFSKGQGMGLHICIPSTWETGKRIVQDQLGLHGEALSKNTSVTQEAEAGRSL